MLSSLPLPAIGAIMLVLFGLFYYLKIFAAARAILGFTGTILIGSAGFLGHALRHVAVWLLTAGGLVTNWAFGTSVLAAAALVTAGIFVYDLHPRNQAGSRTGWAGIILAALILTGATGIPALNGVAPAVQHGVTVARQIGG